jgi:hypothetical protein
MRKPLTYVICSTFLIFLIGVVLCALEFNRVSGLCNKAISPVSNIHEAINAVRSDRGAWLFPSDLSPLRQSRAFNSDGFEKDGGWRVQEWTEFGLIHGYTVDFEQAKSQIEIKCDVYSCGAVHNCRTLGSSNY